MTIRLPRRDEAPLGLQARRARARLVRLAAACCVGLAVFASLAVVRSTVSVTPVLVTTREVRRGERLYAADVTVRQVPADGAWEKALHEVGQAEGLVAQTTLDRGEPLFAGDVSPTPVAPDGHTVLEVRVASQADGLVAGDTVSLAVAGECGNAEDTNETGSNDSADDMGNTGDDGNDTGKQTDDATSPGVCVLAKEALVMDEPRQPEDGTPGDVLSLAMEPKAALTVMERQEATAIIALHRQTDP